MAPSVQKKLTTSLSNLSSFPLLFLLQIPDDTDHVAMKQKAWTHQTKQTTSKTEAMSVEIGDISGEIEETSSDTYRNTTRSSDDIEQSDTMASHETRETNDLVGGEVKVRLLG